MPAVCGSLSVSGPLPTFRRGVQQPRRPATIYVQAALETWMKVFSDLEKSLSCKVSHSETKSAVSCSALLNTSLTALGPDNFALLTTTTQGLWRNVYTGQQSLCALEHKLIASICQI